MAGERIRAGAARLEITPKLGTHLAGSVGKHRPASRIESPIHAKALVFEQDGGKLCLLSLDVTIITQEYTDKIRAAAQEMGFAPEAVMAHAVQNHSAPPIGHFMADPEVGVLAVQDEGGKMLALILHHTCHPACTYITGEPAVTRSTFRTGRR